MGTEALWVPLLATAIGGGASMYNAHQTDQRRTREITQHQQNLRNTQRKGDAEVQRLLADTAASNPEEESAQALSEYTEALRRNAGNNTSSVQASGGVSDAFKADSAAASGAIDAEGKTLSGLMSRIDGAIRQREGEGNRRMETQSILGLLGREMEGDTFLHNMRLDGIRESPWLTALSSASSGFAQGYTPGSGLFGGKRTKPLRYKGYSK